MHVRTIFLLGRGDRQANEWGIIIPNSKGYDRGNQGELWKHKGVPGHNGDSRKEGSFLEKDDLS